MRVAIVTETWPPEVNGVALTVESLARGVAGLGHEVQIVRPRRPRDAGTDDSGFATLVLPGASLPRYPGLHFGLPAPRRLRQHWSECAPDVAYVATEGPLGLSALAAARRLGIPVCTGFHTRFDDFVHHYGFGFLTPAVFGYLRRFHNRASATLVPTAELHEFLRSSGFRNVHRLRRAVDTSLFRPALRDPNLRSEWGLERDDLAVLHVGRLAPEKNLDLAVRAFAAIRERHRRARMVVVGDGPSRATMAGSHPGIVFAGMRRGEDLARHYASGDLFLFPSLTETFGNVTLEALASGLPVIAFDYGAAREHVRADDAGWCAPAGDEAAFVRAAVDLADRLQGEDAAGRERIRDAARAMVADLSPGEVARHFTEVLAGLQQRKAA